VQSLHLTLHQPLCRRAPAPALIPGRRPVGSAATAREVTVSRTASTRAAATETGCASAVRLLARQCWSCVCYLVACAPETNYSQAGYVAALHPGSLLAKCAAWLSCPCLPQVPYRSGLQPWQAILRRRRLPEAFAAAAGRVPARRYCCAMPCCAVVGTACLPVLGGAGLSLPCLLRGVRPECPVRAAPFPVVQAPLRRLLQDTPAQPAGSPNTSAAAALDASGGIVYVVATQVDAAVNASGGYTSIC